MVAIKIVLTVLGLCVVCSRTEHNKPTLISKLLTHLEDKDVKIPVRRKADDGKSTQQYFYLPSRQGPHRNAIFRILKGALHEQQFRNNNDKRLSQVLPGTKSEDTSADQVRPIINIQNYIPTVITIPCDSRLCDPSESHLNYQTSSDIAKPNIPFTNSIHSPEHAPSHDVGGHHSYVISEAPNVIFLSSPSGEYSSNTNEDTLLHTSDDDLSERDFSIVSDTLKLPLSGGENLATAELPSPPTSHSKVVETYFDAVNANLHKSNYHKFAEFTSYPQLSIPANDEIITPGIDINVPLNPPSPFESLINIPLPEPPAYFPLNLSNNEAVDQTNKIVSILETHDQSDTITIPENTPSTFENQPIIDIPEAPELMPLNPPNVSYNYSLENNSSDKFIHSDYLEISHPETTSQRGDISESTDTDIQTITSLNPSNSIEPAVSVPEPPIYFPLNPSNSLVQSETGEILSLLNDYESSYTISIPENPTSSVGSLPNIVVPEAPELMPLNPSNITFDSPSENIFAHEITENVHADYSDIPQPEITTEPEEVIDGTYMVIPPAPVLMPLNPPNITFTLTDTSYSDNFTSDLVGTVGTDISNPSSTVQNYKPSIPHTLEHSHLITLDDSPNLLIGHIINTQNDKLSTTSSNFESPSLQSEPIVVLDKSELTPLPQPQISIISSDILITKDKITSVDNQKESLSAADVKIPEAPLLMPINPPFTNPPLNSIVTSNNLVENTVIQDENVLSANEVPTLASKPQTLESKITKDELFVNSEIPTTELSTTPTSEGSELNVESSPLNILLSVNQQITLPRILHNSNVLVVSNDHKEIRGRENSISCSPDSSANKDCNPLSIVQDSNVLVSSSPINAEKTNEIVSQLDSTIQKLKTNNAKEQIQQNLKDLPPCESEKPTDGVVNNYFFEPKKCKQEVKEWTTSPSSNESITKRSRRRKVVVRKHRIRKTDVTKNVN